MNNMFQNLPMALTDPSIVAAAEAAKARIQSAYIMAMQKPRNEEQARTEIIEACKRIDFAEMAEYSKPVGGAKITGPSIRFAEVALQKWQNVMTESQVLYEDDNVRRVRVYATDLEKNTTFTKDLQISKTVERKSTHGREIVRERVNTNGEKVFIVRATDDEMMNKEGSLVSKAIRNEGLRLIPKDIIDEALEVARKTVAGRIDKDPKAELRKLTDAFAGLGIKPVDLEKYLGQSIATVSPAQIVGLRKVYVAVRDGQPWSEFITKGDDSHIVKPSVDELEARRRIIKFPPAMTGELDPVGQVIGETDQAPPDASPARQLVDEATEAFGSDILKKAMKELRMKQMPLNDENLAELFRKMEEIHNLTPDGAA